MTKKIIKSTMFYFNRLNYFLSLLIDALLLYALEILFIELKLQFQFDVHRSIYQKLKIHIDNCVGILFATLGFVMFCVSK